MEFPRSFTVITDEISQDLDVVAQFLRGFGLPGLELRSMFGRAFKDLTAQDLAAIRRVSQAEGWRVYGCSTPVFKCALDDPAAIREHRELFKRSVETARSLECDLLRVFTFLRTARPADKAALQAVADHLHQLLEIARDAGLRIGVENEHSCLIATAAEMAALMALLPEPDIGIIWDPCNILYLPEGPAPVTSGFAQLAPRILHIHVKDAVRRRRTTADLPAVSVPVGLGEVGWRTHLAEIRRSGYRGLLSLETHWRLEQIDEKSLHLPAGYAFSRGGEEASRTCLRNLQGLVGVLE